MNDRTRLGAAVVGGYVLGRTKKGAAAIRLAMWLNGTSTGTLARDGLRRLKEAPEVNKLLFQAGRPLMEAARSAAFAAVESRITGIAEGLSQRTTKLLPSGVSDEQETGEQETAEQETAEQEEPADKSGAKEAEDRAPTEREAAGEGQDVDQSETPGETGSASQDEGESDRADSAEGEPAPSKPSREPAAQRQAPARKAATRNSPTPSAREREKAAT